jgi:hypothetical protein
MGWTVIKFNAHGKEDKKASSEFYIHDFDDLDISKFKAIKFLDPYGDYTFGGRQLDDLVLDLQLLNRNGQVDAEQLSELLALVAECGTESGSYLEFCGD